MGDKFRRVSGLHRAEHKTFPAGYPWSITPGIDHGSYGPTLRYGQIKKKGPREMRERGDDVPM
jgi:hypothetical protein